MAIKKPENKKIEKKFNFSRAIDRVSITLLIPQVNDAGGIERVEVEHHFKIDSLFDAMEAFRSALYVVDEKGAVKVDQGAAGFALWWETIESVEHYDFSGVEDWKEFFKTDPVAREHATQAGALLSDQLGMIQGKLSVPFGKSGS